MFKYIRTCVQAAMLPLLLTACKHDDLEVPTAQENYRLAGDFIKNNYDLSLFNAAVEKAGLTAELNQQGPITLLAPGNTAFNELGIRKPSDFDAMNVDSLRDALHYHILNRRLNIVDIPVNGVDIRYETLYKGLQLYTTYASYTANGDPQYGPYNLFFNGALAAKKDITLVNGSMYVIDKVMKYTPGTIQQWLSARAEYSVFVSALKHFGLWEQLAKEGPFTVLAPDNTVLEAGGITEATLATLSPDEYIGQRLFGVYIIQRNRYFVTDFSAFQTIYGKSGYTARIDNDTYSYNIFGNSYVTAGRPSEYTMVAMNQIGNNLHTVVGNISGRNDNLTDNGVIHYIPQMLYTPEEAKK